MSEFDKEKEREKLREKFERDEERRQTTQEMSELLLQGATMLNIHCADCASPIFSHEGKEFCPTCGRTVDEIQTSQPTEDEPSEEDVEQIEEPTETPQTAEPADVDVSVERSPEPEHPSPPSPRPSEDRGDAGSALEATIIRLSDRAGSADDPRQAEEWLAAARTAAETLAILHGRDPSN